MSNWGVIGAGTMAGRPLRWRAAPAQPAQPAQPVGTAGPAMQYGAIPGLDKPVARLVQGADRNVTLPDTEVPGRRPPARATAPR